MLRLGRLLMLAVIFLLFGAACAERQGSVVVVEILSWSIDEAAEEPASSDGLGPMLRVSGTAALRMTIEGEPTEVVLGGVDLVSNGTGWVATTEAEALEGDWPVTVRPGVEEERLIRYEGTIPLPYGPPACGYAAPLSELTLTVFLWSEESDVGGMSATSDALPIPGREDAGPTDWGFEEVMLTPTMVSALTVEDLVFQVGGPIWMVVGDSYSHLPSVVELRDDNLVTLWSSNEPQVDLGVTTAGPVVTTRTGGLVITQLSASTPWVRQVTGAGAAGSTHASGGRVVVAYPAHGGALLDEVSIAEPVQDNTVIFELAATTGALGRVAVIPGDAGPAIGLSDGGVAIAQPGATGNEVVVLSPALEERFRVEVPGGLPFVLEEGRAGELLFLGWDTGSYVGRISALGVLEWTTSVPVDGGPGTTLAAMTGGGVLLASAGHLTEVDAAGTVLRTEEVACDAALWLQGSGGAAHLAGFVGQSVSIDGTMREVEYGNYHLLRALRR